jgi:hypothetical protein
VLNSLLDARLKLERAIVRFTNGAASADVHTSADESTDVAEPAQNDQPTSNRTSRFTTIFASLLVVGLIVYLYSQGFFNELISLVGQGR